MTSPTDVERRVALAERGLPKHRHADVVTGQVRQPKTGQETTFYTNGSVSTKRVAGQLSVLTGWGYLSPDGRYGCGRYPQFTTKVGNDAAVVTELRAVWHAIGDILADGPVTLFLNSRYAGEILNSWRAGSTDMPGGYTGSRRKTPTLELLRRQVAAHPDKLTMTHAAADRDAVVYEGADTLAQLGMRWGRDRLTRENVETRAEGIAEGFLADYRRRCQ